MFESMRMLSGLLIGGAFNSEASELAYHIICLILLIAMLICAVASIVIVLFQPGNSTGIDALGGSSETFFGKNKGRSMESKMKKWTAISLIVLGVLSIVFYILQFPAIWGIAA